MTAQEHIQAELEALKQPIEHVDIGNSPLGEAIFARVMSKKFRKLKATPFVEDFIKESINIAISNKKPLAIGAIHGGTKPWHFDEYPEVDWSELFATLYLLKWMRYIAEVYEHGVWLEFYSMDVCQERMNNLPKSETDQYSNTFQQVNEFIQGYVPDELSVSYRRWSEDFDDVANFDKELDAAIVQSKKKLKGKLPKLTSNQKYATEMNCRPTDEQKKDSAWREKVEIIHMSVEETPTFQRYLNDRRFIPSCPTPVEGTIVIGSTKRSIAKYWFGAGGLEPKANGSYNEIVLTPKMIKRGDFRWEKVDIKGLSGKNFKKIRILDKTC